MKLSSKMLQILPYFWNTKTQIVFSVYHFEQLWVFFTVDAAVCVDVDQAGHALGKKIKQHEMKNEKTYVCFLYSKNMAKFEAFC